MTLRNKARIIKAKNERLVARERKKWNKFTWESRGSASRETRCCKLTITLEAANMGSIECWGIAAWPPFPLIVASKKPFLAYMRPDLEATSPIGNLDVTCNPKIAATFSKAPDSTIFLAPPPPSSAGWKTRTTVPYLDNKITNYIRDLWGENNRTRQFRKKYQTWRLWWDSRNIS